MPGAGVQGAARLRMTAAGVLAVPAKRLYRDFVPSRSAGKLIFRCAACCIMRIVKLIAHEKQRDAVKLEKRCCLMFIVGT